MSSRWDAYLALREKNYQDAVARGEHDEQCEHHATRGLCHCSKRRREALGHTEPPEELMWQNPICPRCYLEVEHDGDSWTCPRCCVHWDQQGQTAEFYDDYGDLTRFDDTAKEVTR